MQLRRATSDDALDVLDWRNDPHSREMSRQKQIIATDAHLIWFAAALQDRQKLLLIGERGGEKVGMVRFDDAGRGVWTTSIAVAPACRGRGMGSLLLSNSVDFLVRNAAVRQIDAEVMTENTASRRIFEKCGFVLRGSAEGFDHWVLNLNGSIEVDA
jgi:RimJ/RimL family protein N-acetyltransferase